jgi:hypothetical protein
MIIFCNVHVPTFIQLYLFAFIRRFLLNPLIFKLFKSLSRKDEST